MWEYIINILSDYWFWGITGFFIGSILAVANLLRNNCRFTSAIIAVTISVYFGALGTRMLYILIFHPQLFVDNPILAMAFWQETGTWLGGPLLGGLAFAFSLKILKEPVLTNLGSAAPGLALAHAIARIGCLVSGCCYGAPTTSWCAIYSDRLHTMVHPTPIYSMIGELVSLVILQWLWKTPNNRKYLFQLYLLFLSFHRFFSDMFRGSEAGPELIPGFRIFQVVCLIIFIGALSWLLIVRWKKKGLISSVILVGISLLTVLIARSFAHQEISEHTIQYKKGIYLVATRETLKNDLDDWIKNRSNDGYQVMVNAWLEAPSAKDIKDWIKEKKNYTQPHQSATFC